MLQWAPSAPSAFGTWVLGRVPKKNTEFNSRSPMSTTGMSMVLSEWIITPIYKSPKWVVNQLTNDRYDHFHGHPTTGSRERS